MLKMRGKWKAFTILFILLILFSFHGEETYSVPEITVGQNSKEDAAKFIKELVTECLVIVNNRDLSDDQKRHKLSEYVNKFLDIDRITPAVFARLGYKDLSLVDQNKVKAYLKKYLLHFYAGEGKLSIMMNAKLLSDPVAELKRDDFAVTTQFSKNSASPTKIVWVPKNHKIYYIEIDDINQIITLRSEMQAAVGSRELMDYINDH